jgi:hypothetical protein
MHNSRQKVITPGVVAQAVHPAVRVHNLHLHVTDFAQTHLVVQLLSAPTVASTLTELVLGASSVCFLRDDGVVSVCGALEGNSVLRRLDLCQHHIGDRGCTALGALVSANVLPLTSLDLSQVRHLYIDTHRSYIYIDTEGA